MKSKYKKVELSNLEEFKSFINKHKKIKYLDVILGDLSGIIRGKRIPISDADKIFKSGVQFCYSTFLLDTSGYCPDAEGRGFADGDPDANYYPVKNTLSIIPWHKDNIAQVLITIQDESRYSSIVDPRNVLAKVWNSFSKLKFYPRVAFELEFYLIKRRNKLDENPTPPTSIRNKRQSQGTQVYGMSELDDFYDFLEDINRFCRIQNIPASTASSEFAPGQFEINLNSTVDLLKAADDSVLLRRLVKETAINHGYEATFLSKPYLGEAGNGMHLHLSLYDKNNKNIFFLLFFGDFFFIDQNELVDWRTPWILTCLGASFFLFISPFLSIVSGLGSLEEVLKIRTISGLFRLITFWLGLLFGFKLYSLGISLIVEVLCLVYF